MRHEPQLHSLRLLLIDLARKTQTGKALSSLRETQWLALDELQSIQLEKLNNLLSYLVESVPYYQEFSRETGFVAGNFKTLADISSLPVMTKEKMKEDPVAFQPLGRYSEAVLTRKTGGSTGTPFKYLVGSQAFSGQWAAVFRAWEWSGYRLGEQMVTIGGGSVSPAGGASFSQKVYNALRRNIPLDASALDSHGLEFIESSLKASQPSMVYGYPSVLYQVARHIREKNISIPGVQSVVTTSEMLFPGQRRELEAAFKAPVFDQYGCNEANLVTCECEAHEGRHVAMEGTLVEILDEQDNPVPKGMVGRIVATGLDNRAMAFVRYDTGDLGALDSSPCSCGRKLERIVKLQGRTRDLVRASNGTLIHGVAFNEIALKYSWLDRYQAIQENREQLTLIVSSSSTISEEEQDRLRGDIESLCGLKVNFMMNSPFEKTAGQKTRVIISRLEELS